MLPRGLKAKINLNILILLIISMALVDIVMLVVIQRELVKAEAQEGSALLEVLATHVSASKVVGQPIQMTLKKDNFDLISSLRNFDCFFILDADLKPIYVSGKDCLSDGQVLVTARNAILKGQPQRSVTGKAWAIFQQQGRSLCMANPLLGPGRPAGAVGIIIPLGNIHRILITSQRITGFYLLINLILFGLLGYYGITRVFLKPIQRLVKRAEEYHEDDSALFSVRWEDGELNKLSTALNRMLARISRDKQQLQHNVLALEKANDDLRQAQREVIRAEKLASVGRLSAGIAHEIGNPIGIILGYLDLLKTQNQLPEQNFEYLERAESEVHRINSIIRQLLNLSRPLQGEPMIVPVHQLLQEMVPTVAIQPLMSKISFQLALEAENDLVLADPDHLRQVFLNLLINAADAISAAMRESCGQIRISSQAVNDLADHRRAQRRMLKIMIVDDGQGIAEEDLANIFDPFYTTKDPGKGTGLGLSVSLTIIHQLGGTITAESIRGTGTTMTIHLPLQPSPDAAKLTEK